MSNLTRRLQQIAPSERNPRQPFPVNFGTWAPDLPDFFQQKANEARNVIPAQSSYLPVPSPVEQSDPLDGRVFHGLSGKDNAGNAFTYAATAQKLWDVRPGGNTDKSGIVYSTPETGAWDATQFGSRIIFTNYVDDVQSISAGSVGNFADLFTSTDKPKARWCATVRNFLMIGNTNDTTDGPVTNRLRWSAINDPTDMDPDTQTQSDFEDIQDGGAIQRIVGGADYGVVMQENQICRVSYTGDATIWRIDPIDRSRGTSVPKSVVGNGRNVFYVTEEGFFMFTGTESIPIGDNRVDETFWNQFDPNNRHRVSATMSFDRKLYGMLFPGSGSTGGNPNKIFVYNWTEKRWAEIFVDLEFLTQTLTQGYTLEELDTVSPSIDDLPYSLDDPIWQGGLTRLGAYTRNNRLSYFIGANLEAIVDTNEFQMFGGRRAFVDFLRVLVDGASTFTQIGGRNSLTDTFNDTTDYSAETTQNADGLHPVKNNNRYQRIRVRIPEGLDWTHAQGVMVDGRRVGSF